MARSLGWGAAALLVAAAAVTRCGGSPRSVTPLPPVGDADGGDPALEVDASVPTVDAGNVDAGPVTDLDAGTADAGPSTDGGGSADAGSLDAGQPDAGPPPPTLVPPSRADITWVPASNLVDASADEGGFVWAVSREGTLYLLRPGATHFEAYGIVNNGHGASGNRAAGLLSVAGGAPGEAWVGYEGVFQNGESDDPSVPLDIRQSGGADHFYATPTSVALDRHVMFWTPPGVLAAEPAGRWKVRSIFSIVYNHGPSGVPGDVFFGGTHGTAMVHANGDMEEHQHAGYNYCPTANWWDCSLVAGDHHGVAIHPATGNVWIGADFAEELLPYMTSSPHEWWNAHSCEAPWSTLCDGRSVRTWVNRSVDPERPEWGGRDFAQGMAFDAYGDLWVASYFNGLARLRIDPATGKTTAKSQADIAYWNHRDGTAPAWPADPRNGKLWDYVWTVAGDPDGSIWVGGPHGAWRLVAATAQWVSYGGLLPGQNVSRITIDPRPGQRAVYLATNGGLVIYRGK